MNIPTPDEHVAIHRMLPTVDEMLRYCIESTLEISEKNSMAYDAVSDTVTYRLTIHETDRELFPMLRGTDEIWITTGARRES